MYADDNHERLVSANTTDWVHDGPFMFSGGNVVNDDAIESGALFNYCKSKDVYRCPSDKSDFLHSYSISYYMNGEKSKPVKSRSKIYRPAEKLVFN